MITWYYQNRVQLTEHCPRKHVGEALHHEEEKVQYVQVCQEDADEDGHHKEDQKHLVIGDLMGINSIKPIEIQHDVQGRVRDSSELKELLELIEMPVFLVYSLQFT